MKVEVNLVLKVDPDANFFESDDVTTLEVLMGLIKDQFYDLDDVTISEIELELV